MKAYDFSDKPVFSTFPNNVFSYEFSSLPFGIYVRELNQAFL
jgi:hypothetical protein